MKNLSLNNESLQLNNGESYLLIDALYLDELKDKSIPLPFNDILKWVQESFPYTDTPFAIYKAKSDVFYNKQIRKVNYEEVKDDKSFFSTDTGALILVQVNNVLSLLEDYDYNQLVDSQVEEINSQYWEALVSKCDERALGLIMISGSGTYQVVDI